MIRFPFVALLFLTAAPAVGSPAAMVGCCHEAAEIDPSPVDPVRLAAARPLAERLWPDGTYELSSEMGEEVGIYRQEMIDALVESTLVSIGKRAGFEGTYDDILKALAANDPARDQRRSIATSMAEVEVDRQLARANANARLTIAKYLARRFTLTELTDIATFARTTAGAKFIGQLVPMTENDGMEREIRSADPSILMGDEEFEGSVSAATAHLPAVPGRKSD
jgi:hypothetical protein